MRFFVSTALQSWAKIYPYGNLLSKADPHRSAPLPDPHRRPDLIAVRAAAALSPEGNNVPDGTIGRKIDPTNRDPESYPKQKGTYCVRTRT